VPGRARGRADGFGQAVTELPPDPIETPLDALVAHDQERDSERLGARLAALVDKLEDDARVGIWMRFAGDASFEQIGEALQRPPHAVRALVYRQLALLRKRLAEVEP